MAGILANSVSATMVSGDTAATKAVTGYVEGEEIALTVSPTGTDYVWAITKPSGSTARSDLSSDTGAAVTFTPEADGYWLATCVVDSTTNYRIRIAVTALSQTTTIGAHRFSPIADASVPTPAMGATTYYSSDAGTMVEKRTDGQVYAPTAIVEPGAGLRRIVGFDGSGFVGLPYADLATTADAGVATPANGSTVYYSTERGATVAKTASGRIEQISPYRVFPKSFGAVGNGVADDTVYIQDAFEHAQSVIMGGAPYNSVEVLLNSGRYRTTQTVDVPGYIAFRGDHHAAIVPATHDFAILNCAMSNNVIEGIQFIGGKHAVSMFGTSSVWPGSFGHPANTQSTCSFSDCIFWDQRGPVFWQDTSDAGYDRAIAGHIVIEKFNHRGAVLWWGTADGLTVKDGWAQVNNTTYPVAWDDARPMSWLNSHGVVSVEDVSCAPQDANGAWYEGSGIIQSRGWRLGGEYDRVPWRIRKSSMAYATYSLPQATAQQLARVFSQEDAIASTGSGGHLVEIYDDFPSRVVVRRPVPFDLDAPRTDIEFAASTQSIWVDSVSCPSSEWANSSKNSLGLFFETDFAPRIVTSADPTAATAADVTHLLAAHTEHRSAKSVAGGAMPQVNTWPDAAGAGGAGMRYDPSWGYGATGTGVGRSTDSTLGVNIDSIVASATSGSLFYWTSGATTGPDTNWGNGLAAGIYTCSVLVKANYAGELLFSINGGAATIAWMRFEASAGAWQRLAASFYHDGTDRRLMWSAYNIPGTGQPGGAGSIALGLPSVVAGANPAADWRYPQNATALAPATYYGTAAPASGTYRAGDRLTNTAPSAGGFSGWICTAGGSPGTWKGFGQIEA